MSKDKRGFTLIEISLFLAVTGLLFLSVTIGVQNSIYQQRYNDAVQSFADFLGDIYSQVLNVQNDGTGRSEYAIYGKMLTFGEQVEEGGADSQTVYAYDVLGFAAGHDVFSNGGTTMSLLKKVKADVLEYVDGEGYRTVGLTQEFVPKWGSKIQKVDSFTDFEGTILVVRNPSSGTVQTFVRDDKIDVKQLLLVASGENYSILDSFLVAGELGFTMKDVNFCINPDGDNEMNNRTDVRITKNASNASGVVIMPRDDASNVCNKDS